MRTDKQRIADAKSQKKNCKVFAIKLYKNVDGDMIEFLQGLENRNGYLKKLIRDDMEKRS